MTFREREGMKEGKRKKSTKRKEGGRVKEQEKRRKDPEHAFATCL